MHDPIILQRLAEIPPALRELAESNFPQIAAQTLGQTIELTEGQTEVLKNGFFLYLIFILDKDDLLSFLAEEAFIDADQSTPIVDAFLATLPDEIKNANIESNPITTKNPTPPTGSNIYSSTQASILNPEQTQPTDSARWGQA